MFKQKSRFATEHGRLLMRRSHKQNKNQIPNMSKNTPLKTPIRLLVVALALGIMIAFHEFGHFCAARAVGIDVPVFSVGFGPREYSLVIGHAAGTEFRLSPIPLGGYVEVLDLEQAVHHPEKGVQLARWKIWVVGLAGVVNNLLLSGLALYAALCLDSAGRREKVRAATNRPGRRIWWARHSRRWQS